MTARTATRKQTPVWTETHEPEGRMKQIFGPLYITGVVWFALCSWCARWLPYFLCRFFSWIATLVSWVLLRQVRVGITANLNVVLGPTGFWGRELRIYRTLRMFSLVCIDRYTMFHHRDRLVVDIEGKDNWLDAMADETGCILTSGHVGNWEVMSLIPMVLDRRMHVVREREIDPKTQELIDRLYRKHIGPLYKFHFAEDDATLGPSLLLALRRNELVGLSSDQPRTGQGYLVAQMFGHPTPLPHGPCALARAAEAPILPVFGIRLGKLRYRLIAGEPIRVARTADRDGDIAAAVQKVADNLQEVITRSPYSWFCWYSRWPERAKDDGVSAGAQLLPKA